VLTWILTDIHKLDVCALCTGFHWRALVGRRPTCKGVIPGRQCNSCCLEASLGSQLDGPLVRREGVHQIKVKIVYVNSAAAVPLPSSLIGRGA